MKTPKAQKVNRLKRDPLEVEIRTESIKLASEHGWGSIIIPSTMYVRDLPDVLFFKGTLYFLVEFKRKGRKPTPRQALKHDYIRSKEGLIYVCDSVASFWDTLMVQI